MFTVGFLQVSMGIPPGVEILSASRFRLEFRKRCVRDGTRGYGHRAL